MSIKSIVLILLTLYILTSLIILSLKVSTRFEKINPLLRILKSINETSIDQSSFMMDVVNISFKNFFMIPIVILILIAIIALVKYLADAIF